MGEWEGEHAYLHFEGDEVGHDEAWTVDEADIGCPEEGLEVFCLRG